MASRCHPSDTVHRIESVRRYGTSKFSFSSFSSFDDGDDVAKTERHVHEEGTDARGKGTKEKKKGEKESKLVTALEIHLSLFLFLSVFRLVFEIFVSKNG